MVKVVTQGREAGRTCRAWAFALAVVAVTSGRCLAQVDPGEIVTVPLAALPELTSEHPQFARLLAAPGYTTATWLIFDESRGTGTGYDVLHVDFNCDGVIEEGETARGTIRSVGGTIFGRFPSFTVPGCDNPEWPLRNRPRLTLSSRSHHERHDFILTDTILMTSEAGGPDDTWQYRLTTRLGTGTSPENAPLTRLGGEPVLQIEVRCESARRNSLGIGLQVTVGGALCDVHTAAGSPNAEVIVRNRADEVVHRAVQRLERFSFGRDGSAGHWVRIPAGTYTIEAAVDIGPLGGKITATQQVTVR